MKTIERGDHGIKIWEDEEAYLEDDDEEECVDA